MKQFIKYDLKTKKANLIFNSVFTAVWSLSLLITLFNNNKSLTQINRFDAIVAGISIVTAYFIPVLWINYIGVCSYLHRLKKHGYILPYNKNDYNKDLAQLPRDEAANSADLNKNNIESLFLAGLFSVVGIVQAIFFAYYILQKKYIISILGINSSSVVFIFFMILGAIVWFALAFNFIRQSDNKKYRDDVEPVFNTKKRKVRTNTDSGVIILLFLGIFTVLGDYFCTNLDNFIFKNSERYINMNIKSNDLITTGSNGVWNDIITNTEKGKNKLPELDWDDVQGATEYAVFMYDITANNWLHLKACGIKQSDTFSADDFKYEYIGPYPPKGTGKHIYKVVIYALRSPAETYSCKFNAKNKKNIIDETYFILDRANGKSGNVVGMDIIYGEYSR